MALDPEVRKQIFLGVNVDGADGPSKLAAEIARLNQMIRVTSEDFAKGTGSAQAYAAEISSLGSMVSKLTKLYEEATGAAKEQFVALEKLTSQGIDLREKEAAAAIKAEEKKTAAIEAAVITVEQLTSQGIDLREKEAIATAETQEKERREYQKTVDFLNNFFMKEGELDAKEAARKAAKLAKEMADHEKKIDLMASELLKQEQADEELIESGKKLEAARKQQRQDEQRMLAERLAMIQAMKDGVIVAGHAAQAMIDESIADVKATNAAAGLTKEERAKIQAMLEAGRAASGLAAGMNQYANGANQGTQASNKFGYGILNISHAIQDVQYGFGAVLNNIPLVVTALGGGPGLAGTIMAVGVALNVAAPHVKEFGAALGLVTDTTKIVSDSLELNKDKLKALTEKSWKLEVDYRSIEETTRKIEELEERKRALDETKVAVGSKDVGTYGKDVIREGGGRDSVVGQIQGALVASGRDKALYSKEDEDWIKGYQKVIADREERGKWMSDYNPLKQLEIVLSNRDRAKIAELQEKRRQALRAHAEKIAGGVAAGDEGDIASMAMLMKNAPGAFNQGMAHEFGMMPKTREEAMQIANAEELRVEAEARMKKQRAENKRLNDQGAANAVALNQQQAAALKQEISAHATTLGHALGQDVGAGGLPAQIAAGFASGQSAEGVRQALSNMVTQRAGVAGIPPEMVGQVVGIVLDKAIAKIQSEAAANAGDLRTGAAQVAAELAAKAAQQADTAARKPITRARRDASDAEKTQLQNVTSDIEAHTGFSPEVATVAAKDAINRWKHGMDAVTATNSAVQDMMEHLIMINAEAAGSQALFMQKLQRLEAQIASVGHQTRQNSRRAQRGVVPTQPSMIGFTGN